MKERYQTLLAIALACSLSTSTDAANQTFTSEAAFLSAAGSTSFESFEGLTASNTVGNSNIEVISTADFQITHSGPVLSLFDTLTVFDTPFQGQSATDGEQYVYARSIQPPPPESKTMDFTFDAPVNAFGLYLTDVLDTATGPHQIFMTLESGESWLVVQDQQPDATTVYFGIITDQPFSRVSLSNTTFQDGYGIDSVSYRTVPEPACIVLFALGAICLTHRGRFR